MTGAEV